MACITFKLTLIRDFTQNVVKTIKRFKYGSLCNFKEKTTKRYSVLFFYLKFHKLPNLNLFIGFNNNLKKILFSCYIKCNTSHFKEKIYIFL